MKKLLIFVAIIATNSLFASTIDLKTLTKQEIIDILIKNDIIIKREVRENRAVRMGRKSREVRENRVIHMGRKSKGVRLERVVYTTHEMKNEKHHS